MMHNNHLSGTTVRSLTVCALLGLSVIASLLLPQSIRAQREDPPINPQTRAEIIDSIAPALDTIYVFPEVATRMQSHIRKQLQDGAYNNDSTYSLFLRHITEDLQSISKDRHLAVRYLSEEVLAVLDADTLADEGKQQDLMRRRRDNFGFREVTLLPGNIGYVKLNGFSDTEHAGPTAIAAMNFLAHADVVIFDLTDNGGGSPSMIQLLLSYFFEEPTHINSFYVRATDSIQQFWTQQWVPGLTMYDTDLYVLTSGYTFSAAEEFTYNIRTQERGTIVGEVTGGGAHPVDRTMWPNLKAGIQVPFGRAINPVSGTNWEGTGVRPHIEVPADKALATAHLDALQKLKEKTDDPRRLDQLQWTIEGLQAQLKPISLPVKQLRQYVGTYGPRTITLDNGVLRYQREDRPEYELTPMGNDRFLVEDLDYFRLGFERDSDGHITRIVGYYDNGHTDQNDRDK